MNAVAVASLCSYQTTYVSMIVRAASTWLSEKRVRNLVLNYYR